MSKSSENPHLSRRAHTCIYIYTCICRENERWHSQSFQLLSCKFSGSLGYVNVGFLAHKIGKTTTYSAHLFPPMSMCKFVTYEEYGKMVFHSTLIIQRRKLQHVSTYTLFFSSPSLSLYLSNGVYYVLLSIQVGVHHTNNVLKLFLHKQRHRGRELSEAAAAPPPFLNLALRSSERFSATIKFETYPSAQKYTYIY